jgi:hypothetical protein
LFKNGFPGSFALVFGQDAEVNNGLCATSTVLQYDIPGTFPIDFDEIDGTRGQYRLPGISVPNEIGLLIDFDLAMVIKINVWIKVFSQGDLHWLKIRQEMEVFFKESNNGSSPYLDLFTKVLHFF